jgi:carbamoyl-phosphate synthase large subunit
MPKRTDIRTILILGSGPIVIGQGCEFDYSGVQACKSLKAEGFRVVLVNSNPATIMTDPAFSDRTYIEPITPEAVRKIIKREAERAAAGEANSGRIDAILPTLGGQTALNCACKLWDEGTLQEFGVEMIGANRKVIHRAEDRQEFKDIVEALGLKMPRSKTVTTVEEGLEFLNEIGLPAICRPAFTLGGTGGGIAYNQEEFKDLMGRGLAASMIGQVQIDQSVIGWKEYELEVVRDKKDNCIIVCGIENLDPMGVHTGDSITVAPILTLSDKEYQAMRDAAFAIMRAVGVETGGSNVQFAVNPDPKPGPDGKKRFEMVVVEMNPRVSRSSALASKATGFPIAKIAAKLAVGYTLDELRNDITGTTSACFEPTIDYIVTKMPRWTFEKFPEADETLTTQMKSVGEAMAIGRTLKESLQKVIRSMDVKRFGLGLDKNDKWLAAMRAVEREQLVLDVSPGAKPGTGSAPHGLRTADGQPIEWPIPLDKLSRKIAVPCQGRLYYIRYALKMGWSIDRIYELCKIDRFFLDQIAQLVEFEDVLCEYRTLEEVPSGVLLEAKQHGYSDAQLANLYFGDIKTETILKVREHRKSRGIEPVYKMVDTCAAEFEAVTPYYYSTYETGQRSETAKQRGSETGKAEDEIRITDKQKVIILGGGPNRIGQGIEFDYCCCHAAFAARELGFESVMINSNPETVSTDYDTSDLLFFEPLTLEDVLNVAERLNGASATEPEIADLSHVNGVTRLRDESFVHDPNGPIRTFRGDAVCKLPVNFREQLRAACVERGVGRLGLFVAGRTYQQVAGQEVSRAHLEAVDEQGRIWYIDFPPGPDAKLEQMVVPPGPIGRWADERADLDLEQEARVDRWLTAGPGRVLGLVVQFGGQTPLNLAHGLQKAGAPIIGTSVDSIDLAEDRDRFDAMLERLKISRPPSGIARSLDEAVAVANRIGYPVLVRPSYVLGGRGMEVCPDERALRSYVVNALKLSGVDDAPVLIDRFLDAATEVDVDVVADFPPRASSGPSVGGLEARPPTAPGQALIAGLMEHIEQAGIHSGDSSCAIPAYALPRRTQERIRTICRSLAEALSVNGLMNVQLAVKDDEVYILEVNPRASRTAPFVSKAVHVPWPAIAAKVMMGKSLAELGAREVDSTLPATGPFAVKESVFPFSKFPGVDVVLGPEMRSTGEVMGIDTTFPVAFAKAQMAAGSPLPTSGGVFLSVRETDRPAIVEVARSLLAMGFTVHATEGTAEFLQRHNVRLNVLKKIGAGLRPNVLDLMSNGQISLIINTPTRTGWQTDEGKIRATAVRLGIPMITTATAAAASVKAIEALRAGDWDVAALQDYAAVAARADGPAPSVRVRPVAPATHA